jgi:hypothetical protein
LERTRPFALAKGLLRTAKLTNSELIMSFSVLSKIVWARKLTFLLVFVLIAASAVAFTLMVTPVFQSEALLMTTLDRAQRQQTQFPETLRPEEGVLLAPFRSFAAGHYRDHRERCRLAVVEHFR